MATAEDEAKASERDESSSSASNSDNESSSEQPSQVEWLATGRERRSTAGNRMKSMMANEAPAAADDSDLELLFAEDDDDAGFSDQDGDDASDVRMDSSSDDEDEAAAKDDDLEGERELERKEREKKAAARKRRAQEAIPAKFRKKVRIDPPASGASGAATPEAPQPRPKKKSERASWLPSAALAPTRASERATTRISKEQLHRQMVERERRRKKQLEMMEKKAKKAAAMKRPPMTQPERLLEAAAVEKRNAKSLNRWEEAEKQREEERQAKIAALYSRTLEGPVVTFWSGVVELSEVQMKHVGKMVTMEEKAPRKKRQPPAAALAAQEAERGEKDKDKAAATPDAASTPASDRPKVEVEEDASRPSLPEAVPPLSETSTPGPATPSNPEPMRASNPPVSETSTPGPATPSNPEPILALKPALPEAVPPVSEASTPGLPTPSNPEPLLPSRPTLLEAVPPISEACTPGPPTPSNQEPQLATPTAPPPATESMAGLAPPTLHHNDAVFRPISPSRSVAPPPPPPGPPELTSAPSGVLAPPSMLALPAGATPPMIDGSAPMPGFSSAGSVMPHVLAPPNTTHKPSPLSLPPQTPETPETPPALVSAPSMAPPPPPPIPHMAPPPREAPFPPPREAPAPSPPKAPEPEPPKEPEAPLDGRMTRSCIILQNFDQEAVKEKQVQMQILFNRKMSKIGRPGHAPLCAVTHHPARYRDPQTGIPFYNSYAYKELRKLMDGDYKWSGPVGAWMGTGKYAARGVPASFLDGKTEEEAKPSDQTAEAAGEEEQPKAADETAKAAEGGGREEKVGEKKVEEKEAEDEKTEPAAQTQPAGATFSVAAAAS